MGNTFLIANNTFKELLRDRVLSVLIVFALLLVFLSQLMGELSFSERMRISINFSLAALQIAGAFIAVFLGSNTIYREIEKKTISTLLTHPIQRFHFVIGKFLGLVLVLLVVYIGFAILFSGVLFYLGASWKFNDAFAILGIFLESLILLALSIFAGVSLRPLFAIMTTVCLFLVGHWLESLNYFASKGESMMLKLINTLCQYLVPNLEIVNWKSEALTEVLLSRTELFQGSLYSFCWILFFVSAACLVIQRRDFV